MAAAEDWVPRPDTKFDLFQDVLYNQASTNKGSWNIPDAPVTALGNLKSAWDTAWADADNEGNRTSAQVQTKNDARKMYEAGIRKFTRQYLRFNNSVSNAERVVMGITIPDREPSPAPVPTTNPTLNIGTEDVGMHRVVFYDEFHNTKGKPRFVAYCDIRYHIGTEAPTHPDEYGTPRVATKNPVIVNHYGFSGQRVYYIARWVNSRNEPGPWSPVFSGIVT